MKMERDVLKGLCKRLFSHHKESAEVCKGLEEIGKSSGPQHRPLHAHNRDFYERMVGAGERERIMHLPKIMKDALLLERRRNILEKRRHVLRVYKTLEEAGARFEREVTI